MGRLRGRRVVAALALGWLVACERGDPEHGALDGSSGAAGTAELVGQASFVPGDCLPSDGFVVFRGAPFAFERRLGFGPSTPDDHRWGANTLSCE